MWFEFGFGNRIGVIHTKECSYKIYNGETNGEEIDYGVRFEFGSP